MKENKLTIQINKPISDVFSYTVTPPNTKFWVDSIVDEKTSEWPIQVGTVYQEKMRNGEWESYTVINFKEDEIFELASKDGNYHVRYIYKPVGNSACELEYYEWVDVGDLKDPFTKIILEKLKSIIESRRAS